MSIVLGLLDTPTYKVNGQAHHILNGLYKDNVIIIIIIWVIEPVTDFKYLGYRIAEYKSDLEDKLQTYNKINGAIGRHFGKQMNKETKLRIHNITAKAALKF